jgi:histidinol phosphatase-like enzyme (inositol monophosphatase family)
MIELPDVQFLHRLANAADNETLPRFRQPLPVDNKANPDRDFDPVTDADRSAELVLRELITREYPDHAILGEELGATGGGALQWVLDPIDGTRPFICGIPVWGTLIGLTVEGCAKLGMMSQPFTGERFWADAHGAWQRGPRGTARLSVSQVTDLSEAILHTTSPDSYRGELRGAFDTLRGKVRMTRYGGECYAFAMLAAGLIDLCLEPSLQPYDIIPIIPIVEKAGGRVTCLDGSRAEKGGSVLLSATAELHERALEILNTGGSGRRV